jgi:hypothetical protein
MGNSNSKSNRIEDSKELEELNEIEKKTKSIFNRLKSKNL